MHLFFEVSQRSESFGAAEIPADLKSDPLAVKVTGEAMEIDFQHFTATNQFWTKIKQAGVRARSDEYRANVDTLSKIFTKAAHSEIDGGEAEFAAKLCAALDFAAEEFHGVCIMGVQYLPHYTMIKIPATYVFTDKIIS